MNEYLPRTVTRLWLATFLLAEAVDAASLDKQDMAVFLYILIALFLFFIIVIVSVCIHICRLSWAGLKERRGGNIDEPSADLAEYPRQFRIRVDPGTTSRSCREQSL